MEIAVIERKRPEGKRGNCVEKSAKGATFVPIHPRSLKVVDGEDTEPETGMTSRDNVSMDGLVADMA